MMLLWKYFPWIHREGIHCITFTKIRKNYQLIREKLFQRLMHKFVRLNMMKMMMSCFCGMVDRRQVYSLISSQDHCQRSSHSRIPDTPRAGFEPAQSPSSGITTAPRRYSILKHLVVRILEIYLNNQLLNRLYTKIQLSQKHYRKIFKLLIINIDFES